MTTMDKKGVSEFTVDFHQKEAQNADMNALAQSTPWRAPKNGVRLDALMSASLYPLNDDEKHLELIRTSIRQTPQEHEDIDVIVKLWNEFDRILGRKRSRKWKAASVLERLVSVGIDGFWASVGGRPTTAAAREDFVKQAIERLKKSQPQSKR